MASRGDHFGEVSENEPPLEGARPNRNLGSRQASGNTKHTRLLATIPENNSGNASTGQVSHRPQIPNLDPADSNGRYVPPGHQQGNQGEEIGNDGGQRPAANATKTLAVVVCENKRLPEDISYHQAITGEEAERRLKKCGNHCYLTRYSEARQCYVLTVYKKKPTYVMKHFKISIEHRNRQNVYKIEGMQQEFNNLRRMLEHYEEDRIDPALEKIGRCVSENEYTSKWCTIL